MKQGFFEIIENKNIATSIYKMTLLGDTSEIKQPGQFVNIKIDGFYLRRPISVCDCENDRLTLIYKVVGDGTLALSKAKDSHLDVLTGLGNGYNTDISGNSPLLIGGGVGVPPLYMLARRLISQGKEVSVILGFNTKSQMFLHDELCAIGCRISVATADGSYGIRGFVTDAMRDMSYSHFYACGPEPMLRAVYNQTKTSGQLSFEERMGCGFGACMGCSCKTITGNKRICKEGPVLMKEEIIWHN